MTREPMTLTDVAAVLTDLDHAYWCATRSITRTTDAECDCGKDEAAALVSTLALLPSGGTPNE